MKRLAILIAAIGMISLMTSRSEAQHYHHRGYHHHHRPIVHHHGHYRQYRPGVSISIGNGFNGISYSSGYRGYYRPVYRPPVYYGGYGGYGYGRGISVNVGRVYGGYGGGYYRGCGW